MTPGRPGRVVIGGRFAALRRLGAGQEGEVYLARDQQPGPLGARVAVKVLRPVVREDAEAAGRLRREAALLAPLSHPNIVRIVAHGEDPDLGPYLAMEYVDGVPMDAWGPDTPLEGYLEWLRQACLALEHLHVEGVVHRDVKPANLRVAQDGARPRVVLLDFGLSAHAHDSVAGTPQYMAPEVVQRHEVGPPADVYALGVMLFHFIAGRLPFDGAHGVAVALQHVNEPVPTLTPRAGLRVPPAVIDVVRVALAKRPDERFDDAGAFGRAMARAIGQTTAPPQVSAAASRIAAIAGEAARLRTSEPPGPMGPSVEAVLEDHCQGDMAFVRALEALLEAEGVLSRSSGQLAWTRTPRPQRWPTSPAALKARRLAQTVDGWAADTGAVEAVLALDLAGGRMPATVAHAVASGETWVRLEGLGVVQRREGNCWAFTDHELGPNARRQWPAAQRARAAAALAEALGALPDADPLRIARLWGVAGRHREAGEALKRAADEAWARGEHAQALAHGEGALRQINRAPADAERAGTLRVWHARRLRQAGQVEAAVRLAQAGRVEAEREGWWAVLGEAAWLLADVDRDLKAWATAVAEYGAAAAAFEAAGHSTQAVDVRLEQGRLLRALGRLEDAFAAFEAAGQALSEGEDPLRAATIALGAGEVALRAGDPDQAVPRLSAARDAFQAHDRLRPAARAAWLQGEALRLAGARERSREALLGAVGLWQRLSDGVGEATGWQALARLARLEGRPDEGRAALERAAALLAAAGLDERARRVQVELEGLGPA
ncbi:MAG: serine/threonine protein kinase [Myxococcales bacterium]|nr:serine/threonine protein kinase [Myxococcales bacterium]